MKSILKIQKKNNVVCFFFFVVFVFLLFFKSVLFHWSVFNSLLLSSLWNDTISFYKFYMAKLLMPLFISSFVFISKNKFWTIIISIFIDIWCIANIIYYKTYASFLTISDISLISNMNGAWSSVTAVLDGSMFFMILSTIILSLCYFALKNNMFQRNMYHFILCLLLIGGLSFFNNYLLNNTRFSQQNINKDAILKDKEQQEWISFVNKNGGVEYRYGTMLAYLPFVAVYGEVSDICGFRNEYKIQYVNKQSILSYFVAINIYNIFHKSISREIIPFNFNGKETISKIISSKPSDPFPHNNLIIILVESLESWTLNDSVEGRSITPYLSQFKNCNNVLYCNKVKCQVLGGNSADGQMIVTTGLLPIQNGVACMHYDNNVYPNIPHFYPNSVIVNPWPGIWNQDTMSSRYSYKNILEPNSKEWEDENILNVSIEQLKNSEELMCLFAITVSTHVPFNRIRNNSFSTQAPPVLNRYMSCLNYTDSCIGDFIDEIIKDAFLKNSTIVITSDHTIFKSAMLTDFMEYSIKEKLSISSGENNVPLIIYSPQIEGNVQIDELCYQMDIFPTILHLIGCEDYYWKGFGVNLLDSVARHNRSITEEDAYTLSDKLIRSNYFEQYSD